MATNEIALKVYGIKLCPSGWIFSKTLPEKLKQSVAQLGSRSVRDSRDYTVTPFSLAYKELSQVFLVITRILAE